MTQCLPPHVLSQVCPRGGASPQLPSLPSQARLTPEKLSHCPRPRPQLSASTRCRDSRSGGKDRCGAPRPLQGSTAGQGTLRSQPWGRQHRGSPASTPAPRRAPQPPAFLHPLLKAQPACHPSEDTDTPLGTLRSSGPGVTRRHISCHLTQTTSRH